MAKDERLWLRMPTIDVPALGCMERFYSIDVEKWQVVGNLFEGLWQWWE